MRRTVRIALLTAFALTGASAALPAFEVDVGAGITIDVALSGIDSIEPLVVLAPWFGPRDGGQAGAVFAVSLGPGLSDASLALCVRAWPAGWIALHGGIGILAAPGQDPPVMPFLLGGLRFEAGHFAFLAPGIAVRVMPTGSDTEAWLGVVYRLPPPRQDRGEGGDPEILPRWSERGRPLPGPSD